MWRHDAYDATHARIQTSRNDAQDDVFAGEDASNLGMGARGGRRLHDADCGRPAFAHKTRDFPNGRSWADHRRLGARIHDRRKVRQGCFFAQSFDVGKHGCRLGICAETGTKLALDTGECTIQLLRRRGTTLDLVQGFVEDFCYVKQANDVSIFIADWLEEANKTRERMKARRKHTKCLKCLSTISCRASVALVVSRVTMGPRVITWLTVVV